MLPKLSISICAASIAVLLLLFVNATNAIDYTHFTSEFNQKITNGPSTSSGATNREVAVFYERSLIELGDQIGKTSRDDIADDFETTVKSCMAVIYSIENGDTELTPGLDNIGLLVTNHFYFIGQTSTAVQDVMSPLQQRGADLWTQLGAADAKTIGQMVPLYLATVGNLPALETALKAKLDRLVGNFKQIVPSDPDCTEALFELTVLNLRDTLDEFNATVSQQQTDANQKLTVLLDL